MGSTLEPVNLEQLDDSYEVIGELAGREDARTYVGTRRTDGAPVLIAIARTPPDDEGDALSLLAADTNLLATLSHRNLLPIVDGRWIGTDAFAVLSERVAAPTLDELLSRDQLSFPRIAAILREVNGLLEWARGQKIVHRAITPDTLFVESGSDRVLATFAISPIPFGRTSPIGVDARTIAALAKTMLDHHADVANRLVEETKRLLELSHTTETVPDIPEYIATIAMAEALKRGEIEYAHASNAIQELQQAGREKLEAERREHERAMADQKKQFEKEREEFERALAKERQELAKGRQELAKEREAHDRDRERFAADRAALEGKASLYAATEELPAFALAEPTLAEPTPAEPTPAAAVPAPYGRGWWNVGLVAGALVVITGASTLAVTSTRRGSTPTSRLVQVSAVSAVDSAPPPGVAALSAVPLPTVSDSVMHASALADSMRQARIARIARAARAARRAAAAVAAQDLLFTRTDFPVTNTISRADSASGLVVSPTTADSLARRDTLAKARLDTLARRDTLRRTDTLRRDTLRTDTLSLRPSRLPRG